MKFNCQLVLVVLLLALAGCKTATVTQSAALSPKAVMSAIVVVQPPMFTQGWTWNCPAYTNDAATGLVGQTNAAVPLTSWFQLCVLTPAPTVSVILTTYYPTLFVRAFTE